MGICCWLEEQTGGRKIRLFLKEVKGQTTQIN